MKVIITIKIHQKDINMIKKRIGEYRQIKRVKKNKFKLIDYHQNNQIKLLL